MSQFELGQRMGVSQPRVAQIERAEAEQSIELKTLSRAAAALGCSLWYVLAPAEPLGSMVQRQALERADGDPALAEGIIDTPGLWRCDRASTPRSGRRPAEEGV
jgi:transcriptional regulator with XRE-family HTH domain